MNALQIAEEIAQGLDTTTTRSSSSSLSSSNSFEEVYDLDCPIDIFLRPYKTTTPIRFNKMNYFQKEHVLTGNYVRGDFFEYLTPDHHSNFYGFGLLWYTKCNLQTSALDVMNLRNLRKSPDFEERRKQPGTLCLLSMKPWNITKEVLEAFRKGKPIMQTGSRPQRVYTLVPDEHTLFKMYDSLSRGDRFFQEIFFEDTPHHFYLDIEKDLHGDVHDSAIGAGEVIEKLHRQLRNVFVPVLLDFLNNYMEFPTKEDDVLITDSSRRGIKFSVHLVIANGRYFQNVEDSLGFATAMFVFMHRKAFGSAKEITRETNAFREFYSFVDTTKPNLDSAGHPLRFPNLKTLVDYSVYGKTTQNMRMVGSAKLDSLMKFNEDYRLKMRVLMPTKKNVSRPARDYFITVLKPDREQAYEPTPEYLELFKMMNKKRRDIDKYFGNYSKLKMMGRHRGARGGRAVDTVVSTAAGFADEAQEDHFITGITRLMNDGVTRRCEILKERLLRLPYFRSYKIFAEKYFADIIRVIHPDSGDVVIENYTTVDGFQLLTAKVHRTCNAFRKADGSVGQLCYFNCTSGTHMAQFEMLLDLSIGYHCFACRGKAIIVDSILPDFELTTAVRNFLFEKDPAYDTDNSFLLDQQVVKLNTPQDHVSEFLPEIKEREDELVIRYDTNEKYMRSIHLPINFKHDRNQYRTYILHGKMGSGKSTVITDMIEETKSTLGENKCKIMAVTFRTILANKAASEMGLTIYTTKEIWTHGKIAIQMDSIHKTIYDLVESDGSTNAAICTVYDVVIVDETCSLLAHLMSKTMEKKLRMCFMVLQTIIQRSRVVIFADADFGIREQHFVRECRGVNNLVYHFNPFMSINSKYIEYCGEYEFLESLISQLLVGGRVFYASNIKRRLEVHKKYIEDRFIYMYYFNKYFAMCKMGVEAGLLSLQDIGVENLFEADFDSLEKASKLYFEKVKNYNDENKMNEFYTLLDVYLSEIQYHATIERIVRCIHWNHQNPDYFFGSEDDERIVVISGTTSPTQKSKWTDDTKLWERCALLMVSPTVGAGVDYNGDRFNSVYIYAADGSCCARAVHQMRGRCRYLKNQTCHVYITPPKEDFHEMNPDELHKMYPHSIETCEQENLRNLIESNDAELVHVLDENDDPTDMSIFVRKRGLLGVIMDYNMLETNLSIINFRKCFVELAVRDNPQTEYYLSNKFDLDKNFWFSVVCKKIEECVKNQTIDAIAKTKAYEGNARKEFLELNRYGTATELDNLVLDDSAVVFVGNDEETAEVLEFTKRKNEILAFFDLRADIPVDVLRVLLMRLDASDYHGRALQQIDTILYFVLGEQRLREICVANKRGKEMTSLEDGSKLFVQQTDAPEYYINLYLKFQMVKQVMLLAGAPFGDMNVDFFEWFVTHKTGREELEEDTERKIGIQTWILDNTQNYIKLGIKNVPRNLDPKAWKYNKIYKFVESLLQRVLGIKFAKQKKSKKRKRSENTDTEHTQENGEDSEDDFPASQASIPFTQDTQATENDEDADGTYLCEDRAVLRICTLHDSNGRRKCQIRCMSQKTEDLLAEMMYARLTASECLLTEVEDRDNAMKRLVPQLSNDSHKPVSINQHADFLALLRPRQSMVFTYPIEGLILEQDESYADKNTALVDLDEFYTSKQYNVMHSVLEKTEGGKRRSVRDKNTDDQTGAQQWQVIVKQLERRIEEWKKVHSFYGTVRDADATASAWIKKIFPCEDTMDISEQMRKLRIRELRMTVNRNIEYQVRVHKNN